MEPNTLLALDLDGVVSPVKGWTAWGDDVSGYPHGEMIHVVAVSPLLNAALEGIAARPEVTAGWLTSWSSRMRAGMNFPGADWPPVAELGTPSGPGFFDEDAARRRAGEQWSDHRWWKWWGLRAWLAEHPEVTSVVWCDDDFDRPVWSDDEGETPLTFGQLDGRELDRLGYRRLLISPATDTGLTPANLASIRAFLEDEAPPQHVPLPDPLPRLTRGQVRTPREQWERRTCWDCEPSAWYLRWYPWLFICPVCGRTVNHGNDITGEPGPPAMG